MVFNPSREPRFNTAGQVMHKLCIVAHLHLFKSGIALICIDIVFNFDFISCFTTCRCELCMSASHNLEYLT